MTITNALQGEEEEDKVVNTEKYNILGLYQLLAHSPRHTWLLSSQRTSEQMS